MGKQQDDPREPGEETGGCPQGQGETEWQAMSLFLLRLSFLEILDMVHGASTES